MEFISTAFVLCCRTSFSVTHFLITPLSVLISVSPLRSPGLSCLSFLSFCPSLLLSPLLFFFVPFIPPVFFFFFLHSFLSYIILTPSITPVQSLSSYFSLILSWFPFCLHFLSLSHITSGQQHSPFSLFSSLWPSMTSSVSTVSFLPFFPSLELLFKYLVVQYLLPLVTGNRGQGVLIKHDLKWKEISPTLFVELKYNG